MHSTDICKSTCSTGQTQQLNQNNVRNLLSWSTCLNNSPRLKSAATELRAATNMHMSRVSFSLVNTCNLQDTYGDYSSHGAGITAATNEAVIEQSNSLLKNLA